VESKPPWPEAWRIWIWRRYLLGRGRWGLPHGRTAKLYDSMLRERPQRRVLGSGVGAWHTEDLVREFQVSREGAGPVGNCGRSKRIRRGPGSRQGFEDEIVAVEIAGRKGPTVFETDEHNRPGTTLGRNWAALELKNRPFAPDGTNYRRQWRRASTAGGCRDGAGRRGLGAAAASLAPSGAPRLLWHRCRRARGCSASARSRRSRQALRRARVAARRHRAGSRLTRRFRGHRHCRDARARACRRTSFNVEGRARSRHGHPIGGDGCGC